MDEKRIIQSEDEMRRWFEENHESLGYSKIIKSNLKSFPDFVMLKDGKEIRIELELLSSYFIAHKHSLDKVDEVICIEKDVELDVPITELKQFNYVPRLKRVSATIDPETKKILDEILKDESLNFRNYSHAIEYCIKKFWGEKHGKFRK